MSLLRYTNKFKISFGVPISLLLLSFLGMTFAAQNITFGVAIVSLLGAAALGLRHAFDADHIVTIDNVVRALRSNGRKAHLVGMFFSLGHSSIVLLAMLAITLAGVAVWETDYKWVQDASTVFIILFLTIVVAINLYSLKKGKPASGPIHALLGPLLRRVKSQWQMLVVGALFGLGLDTAIALSFVAGNVALSSGQSAIELLFYVSLVGVFAGMMSLGDSINTALMNNLYTSNDAKRVAVYQKIVTSIIIVAATVVAISLLLESLGYTLAPMPSSIIGYVGIILATGAFSTVAFIFWRNKKTRNVLY